LKAHFEQIGEVASARVITDRDSGRSKGFGFVTFTELDAAVKAQESANGGEINGRAIFVSFAREEERKPRTDRPARY
jgi:RNA recognition motif-containing protein